MRVACAWAAAAICAGVLGPSEWVLCAPPLAAAPRSAPTRADILGAWRLVRIDYRGPSGAVHDPFYQAGSSGLIVYDAAGWMSVQIAAPVRPSLAVPAVRGEGATHVEERKARAFDTFYAYYGTWDYDPTTAVVTHHVASSLLPGEVGLSYAQQVTVQGDRLLLTVREGVPGAETVRTKIWKRVAFVSQ